MIDKKRRAIYLAVVALLFSASTPLLWQFYPPFNYMPAILYLVLPSIALIITCIAVIITFRQSHKVVPLFLCAIALILALWELHFVMRILTAFSVMG